jgi:predicted metal-binding membrane protein
MTARSMKLLKRLADPVRIILFAMAVSATALTLFFTTDVSATMMTAIGVALCYVLPALIMDDMGKMYMDATVAVSTVLAIISVAEAYLIRTGWGSLVVVGAVFPPLAARLAVCLMRPTSFSIFAFDLAMFGFFVLLPTAATFARHSAILLLFVFSAVIGYIAYIYLFLEYEEGCVQ